jgi:hypothetical protein
MQYINTSFFEYIKHLCRNYNARRAEFSTQLVDGITYELRVPNENSLISKLAYAKKGETDIRIIKNYQGYIPNSYSPDFDLVGTYPISKHNAHIIYCASCADTLNNNINTIFSAFDKVYWVSAYDIIRAIYDCNVEEDQRANTNVDIFDINNVEYGIYTEIAKQRKKQNIQWGESNHAPPIWLTILAKKQGDLAKSILRNEPQNYKELLLELSAVCVAAIGCFDRNVQPITQYDNETTDSSDK